MECKMGAAGDMLMAALYELLTESQKQEFLASMNALFPDVARLIPEAGKKCGICGTHMRVLIHGEEEDSDNLCPDEHFPEETPAHTHTHNHEAEHDREHTHGHDSGHSHDHADGHHHEHHTYSSVLEQIHRLPIPAKVASDAAAVYRLIGEAEAHVHGTVIEQIHFHEVGSLDALIDVVGCCLLFDKIGADTIFASPIHVGNGTVHCAHGVLPVPAPATAELLKGITFYTGDIDSELCTPTGAAILKHFVTEFSAMPPMVTDAIGVGLGRKDFKTANCVRVFCGTPASPGQDLADNLKADASGFSSAGGPDTICDLSCCLDDMTGEDLGYCMEVLFEEGALDVYYQPIQMKKNRPGILLHCLCRPEDREKFIRLILVHTTTRGVRYELLSRVKLDERIEEIKTPYGTVRNKISYGCGITKSKYEFEDIKKSAKENNLSLADLRKQMS
jgi:hypothetical protein